MSWLVSAGSSPSCPFPPSPPLSPSSSTTGSSSSGCSPSLSSYTALPLVKLGLGLSLLVSCLPTPRPVCSGLVQHHSVSSYCSLQNVDVVHHLLLLGPGHPQVDAVGQKAGDLLHQVLLCVVGAFQDQEHSLTQKLFFSCLADILFLPSGWKLSLF